MGFSRIFIFFAIVTRCLSFEPNVHENDYNDILYKMPAKLRITVNSKNVTQTGTAHRQANDMVLVYTYKDNEQITAKCFSDSDKIQPVWKVNKIVSKFTGVEWNSKNDSLTLRLFRNQSGFYVDCVENKDMKNSPSLGLRFLLIEDTGFVFSTCAQICLGVGVCIAILTMSLWIYVCVVVRKVKSSLQNSIGNRTLMTSNQNCEVRYETGPHKQTSLKTPDCMNVASSLYESVIQVKNVKSKQPVSPVSTIASRKKLSLPGAASEIPTVYEPHQYLPVQPPMVQRSTAFNHSSSTPRNPIPFSSSTTPNRKKLPFPPDGRPPPPSTSTIPKRHQMPVPHDMTAEEYKRRSFSLTPYTAQDIQQHWGNQEYNKRSSTLTSHATHELKQHWGQQVPICEDRGRPKLPAPGPFVQRSPKFKPLPIPPPQKQTHANELMEKLQRRKELNAPKPNNDFRQKPKPMKPKPNTTEDSSDDEWSMEEIQQINMYNI